MSRHSRRLQQIKGQGDSHVSMSMFLNEDVSMGQVLSLGVDGGNDDLVGIFGPANDYEEQVLVNAVPIFLLLVLSGISLGFVSFAVREFVLSKRLRRFNPTSSTLRENEWASQTQEETPEPYANSEFVIPQTRVYSLTSDEIVNLKLVDCKNTFAAKSSAFVSDEESNYFSRIRVLEEGITSSGILDKSPNTTQGEELFGKLRYSTEQLFAISLTVQKPSVFLRCIPITEILKSEEIEKKLTQIQTIVLAKREKSCSRQLYLLMLVSLTRNPAINVVEHFVNFIETLIYGRSFYKIYSNCILKLQVLLLNMLNNFFIYQWNSETRNSLQIPVKSQIWESITPYVLNKKKLLQLITHYFCIMGTLHHDFGSYWGSYAHTLLKNTIRELHCSEFRDSLPVICLFLAKNGESNIKLEMYTQIKALIEEHYLCCLKDSITTNSDLKRIIQHGIYCRQDNGIKECSQEMIKFLCSRNKDIGNWLMEINNSSTYVSPVFAATEGRYEEESIYIKRPITPGAWNIHEML